MRSPRVVVLLSMVAALVGAVSTSRPAMAEPAITGPTITLTNQEVAVGDYVAVTLSGFTAPFVTVAVCGNEARRGSIDCNMVASSTIELKSGVAKTAMMPIPAPPGTCPCVIRGSSTTNDEVAVTPIILSGYEIGPIIASPSGTDPLVAVSVQARAVPRGLIGRATSELGGSTPYEVTVSIRNLTTDTLGHLSVSGSLLRGEDNVLATLTLDKPGDLGPGQTWTQAVTAKVPAPSFRDVGWEVVVSGAGPRVVARSTTHHRPVLLVVVIVLLIADLAFLVIRRRMRRHADSAVVTPVAPFPAQRPIDATVRPSAADEPILVS